MINESYRTETIAVTTLLEHARLGIHFREAYDNPEGVLRLRYLYVTTRITKRIKIIASSLHAQSLT